MQIQGGTVSLNLREIVAKLSHAPRAALGHRRQAAASVANLKVVTSSQLGLARNLAKALHALALVLTILMFALYVLAMYLARGHRRRTLMWVGWSLVFAGLIVLLGRKIGQGQLVSAITTDASIEPAANDAYSVATSLLVQVASASIIIGIPVILSAWFAGPARWAVAARRFLAPHFRERPGLAYWITAALLALVFIWGPIPATRNPWEMLLFTILAFLGAHVLRGQIAEEFPDAQPISMRAVAGQYAHSVGEKIGRARAATRRRGRRRARPRRPLSSSGSRPCATAVRSPTRSTRPPSGSCSRYRSPVRKDRLRRARRTSVNAGWERRGQSARRAEPTQSLTQRKRRLRPPRRVVLPRPGPSAGSRHPRRGAGGFSCRC